MQVAIAIGVGLLSVVAGVFELVRAHRLKAVAVSTTGVLVAFHGVHHRYPVFRFSVPDGREVEVRSDVGWTHSRRRVGDPVDVLYDPAEPTHARIGGWAYSGGFAGALAIAIGLVFIATGVLLRISRSGLPKRRLKVVSKVRRAT